MMRVWCWSDVCRVRTSGLSREHKERRRKTKIGTEVAHTRLGHHLQDQKVKDQLAGGGAYCGGLPHSLLRKVQIIHNLFAIFHVSMALPVCLAPSTYKVIFLVIIILS